MSAQSPLVTVEWLAQHLDDPHLVIFDASTGEFRHGPDVIPGAWDFDIDGEMSDLSAPLPHTMPSAAQFQHAARAQGLNEDSLVVVYDAQGIYSSPRAWWMLKSMGAQEVYILSGGLPAWRRAGYPVVARTDAAGDVVPGIVKLRGSAHRAVRVDEHGLGLGRIIRVDSGGLAPGLRTAPRTPTSTLWVGDLYKLSFSGSVTCGNALAEVLSV
ncbi:rhodanese-like domain-containing protein [uncultured Corynebacterium sp.]|uniref:sulfurtransferase n=1 Tax=uncultured Corynebacterium sp. TaxID=159447 RepID=UPI0025FBB72B|nr:rhodanese-like domain-containing protein [uncultured Corynebacterium sp.]